MSRPLWHRCTRWFLSAAALLALAACQGGGDDTGTPTVPGGSGILGSYFVQSFAQYETAAANLRDNVARYSRQQNDWWFTSSPSVIFSSYPLASSRAEYAHAVGLTGAGEIVSVVDAGFLQSHQVFSGTAITTAGTIPVAGHGTGVASIVAGDASNFIGVAPNAGLTLGYFGTASTLAAATNMARNVGAVAQNNSWGYALPVTQSSYNAVFAGTSGASYLSALDNYAAQGVVVFAVSNTMTDLTAGIMEALPLLRPSLAPGWLAVGNALPVFDSSGVQSAQMMSAGCLEAAAWCLVADGTWEAATSSSDSAYDFVTGSSFAAPQVSGALALLAEAFPALNPHDLRIRLLASADNGFFAPDGSVELVSGFSHDYSTQFGHGFLDIRAALLPIGPATLSLGDGTEVSLSEPLLVTGAALGDAVSRSLHEVDVAFSDSLNGGFSMPGEALVATQSPAPLAMSMLNHAVSTDLAAVRSTNSGVANDAFEGQLGRTLELAAPDGNAIASILLPSTGAGADNIGLSVKAALIDEGDTRIDLGLKLARDGGGLIGLGGAESAATSLAALQLGVTQELAKDSFLSLSGELGIARLGSAPGVSDVSAARFSSIEFGIGQRAVFAAGDKLTLGVSLPTAVTSGRAEIVLPVARARGLSAMEPVSLDLAPSDRQVDLTVSYQTPLAEGLELMLELTHSQNYANRSGLRETAGVLALSFAF